MTVPVLAHQGGWDEILLFVGPIVAVVVLIAWLESRARRNQDDDRPIE